jgi:hypothetical protein
VALAPVLVAHVDYLDARLAVAEHRVEFRGGYVGDCHLAGMFLVVCGEWSCALAFREEWRCVIQAEMLLV